MNPHDVLLYPKNYFNGGYDNSWLKGEIGLPQTVDENLSTKPSAQRQFLRTRTSSAGSTHTRRSAPTSISTAT